MKLVRWAPFMEPWEAAESFMDEWNPSLVKGFMPAIDLYQTKDAVVVETPLAGVDPNKVNISIENDVLTIEGSMEKKSEVEEKDYYRKEIRSGGFHRTIALPATVDRNKANASFQNGILKITIPKSEKARPKTIQVKIKGKKKG